MARAKAAAQQQRAFEKGMAVYERDSGKAERMKAHAMQFSWEKAAKAYLELYDRI